MTLAEEGLIYYSSTYEGSLVAAFIQITSIDIRAAGKTLPLFAAGVGIRSFGIFHSFIILTR